MFIQKQILCHDVTKKLRTQNSNSIQVFHIYWQKPVFAPYKLCNFIFFMIDICLNELSDLDLAINLKKISLYTIWQESNVHCCTAMINDVSIPWSNNLKYLGIVFVSGNKMSFDFKLSRSKFFRSFNSIFSKISKANETVIVSLIKSNCIPILMDGVEALDLNKSTLHSLNNPLCLAFGKIFGSYDKKNSAELFILHEHPSFEFRILDSKISIFVKIKTG